MQCKYCDAEFVKQYNNQVYCSKKCAQRMTKIKKKLRQMKVHNTHKKRKCKGCKSMFQEYGMKKYCSRCKEILKVNPRYYKEPNKLRKREE